jgi:long-subunit acyl-CoA synthetase (AMP-forming)
MQTIDSLIRKSCQKHSDQPALCYKLAGAWQHMTYGALWELSDRIAAGMIKSGFNVGRSLPGDSQGGRSGCSYRQGAEIG